MIPAPDAMRCTARHPANSLRRCFKVAHGSEAAHQAEEPIISDVYHASTVWQWRDSPAVSEFPEGPFVDGFVDGLVPATT